MKQNKTEDMLVISAKFWQEMNRIAKEKSKLDTLSKADEKCIEEALLAERI